VNLESTHLEHNRPIVLITGGAKRVGGAITRMLHTHGANVMIHYNTSRQEAETLVNALNAIRPNSAHSLQADLLNTQNLAILVEQTVIQFGKLDVLINNASSYYPTEINDINHDNWEDLIGTNLKAPTFLAQASAKELIKNQGCIVNITDMHVERPKKGYIIYSVAKAGLVTLTKSLAHELSPQVRVNAVAPGPVQWPENNADFDEAYKKRVINQTLLKKIGDPSDIAKAVKFLVFDAPFITGHVLAVDGGRSLNL
jgi:pteridine reductase